MVLFSLFAVQLVVAFVFRNDAARAIDSLTMLAWVYLAAAVVVFVRQTPAALRNVSQLRTAVAASRLPEAAKAQAGGRTSKET